MSMVIIVYRVWRCPACGWEWSDDRTPREAQVFHVHEGVDVRMTFAREEEQ